MNTGDHTTGIMVGTLHHIMAVTRTTIYLRRTATALEIGLHIVSGQNVENTSMHIPVIVVVV